jgi:hypothetical protein
MAQKYQISNINIIRKNTAPEKRKQISGIQQEDRNRSNRSGYLPKE